MGFVAELKRRNVIRMAGLYLVGAWLVTQVAGTVLPMFGAPEWLPGSIEWHGWNVPLVAFARLAGLKEEPTTDRNNRVVVLKALGGDQALPYFGLLTASFPQLASVPRDSLLADASEEDLPRGVQMRVLLGEQNAMLPDLVAVEQMIGEALAATA